MKIKITENIGPIVTHPNGDISITGEIISEINLKEFSNLEIEKAYLHLKMEVEILDDKIARNLIHPSTGYTLKTDFRKVRMEYESRFPVWKQRLI